MKIIINLLIFAVFFINSVLSENIESHQVKTIDGDTFQVLSIIINRQAPVVIYNHGKIIEVIGLNESAKKGYDVKSFLTAIAEYGYNAIAPIREDKLSAKTKDYMLATKIFLKEQNLANNPTSMIGFSRGGGVTLEALETFNQLSSIVLMSPAISEELLTHPQSLPATTPIFLTLGQEDPKSIITFVKEKFLPALPKGIAVLKSDYQGNHQSFWKVRPKHWSDVMTFIQTKIEDNG